MYKENHLEKSRAYARQWQIDHPERKRETAKKYYAANRERICARRKARNDLKENRRLALKCKYGITPEQWDAMFEAQDRKCAACGSPEPLSKLGWHTDHAHATDKVRGILCQPCNIALGNTKENIARLLALVAYLEAHASDK